MEKNTEMYSGRFQPGATLHETEAVLKIMKTPVLRSTSAI